MTRYRDPRQYYSGRIVDEYDAKRVTKPRWHFDMASLPKMLGGVESILDCPVGTARFLPIYQKLGIDVTGLDVSQDMLDKALARGVQNLILGDATDIPLPDKSVDAVVCIRLFIHLQPHDMQRAAAEFARVARKAIVIDCKLSSRTTVPFRGAITHSRKDFLAAFAGWKIAKSRGADGYPMLRMEPQ